VTQLRIIDVTDEAAFGRIPPCSAPGFDHRTCDYWEDADRGSKAARAAWLSAAEPARRVPRPAPDNPFAPPPRTDDANPFAPRPQTRPADPFALDARDADPGLPVAADLFGVPAANPFAPPPRETRAVSGVPRKLVLLDRGRGVFGSYAKVLLADDVPVAYAQFGPLSAYPRAGRLRELYTQLPDAPLPAVITCVASSPDARRHGHARALVEEVCRDLARRGFAAVEAYPDLTRSTDETSAARPRFWELCGFRIVVDDERFPVVRRELE
jgi:GNAT superfamily N-acetyltransferase